MLRHSNQLEEEEQQQQRRHSTATSKLARFSSSFELDQNNKNNDGQKSISGRNGQLEWSKLLRDYEKLSQTNRHQDGRSMRSAGQQANINKSANINRSKSMIARYLMRPPVKAAANTNDDPKDISLCLSELVESIAKSREAEEKEAADQKSGEEPQVASFKIHEAVLAQTRSTSCSSSGSSEETAESRLPAEQRPQNDGSLVRSLQVGLVGEFCIDQSEASDLRRVSELAGEHASKQNVDFTCSWTLELRQTKSPWSSSVEWLKQSQQVNPEKNQLDSKQVLNCFSDQNVVIWILDRQRRPSNQPDDCNRKSGTTSMEVDANNNNHEDALDLDDIAMALNEPVNWTKPDDAPKQKSLLDVVYCLCRSQTEAKQFEQVWWSVRLQANEEFCSIKQDKVDGQKTSAGQHRQQQQQVKSMKQRQSKQQLMMSLSIGQDKLQLMTLSGRNGPSQAEKTPVVGVGLHQPVEENNQNLIYSVPTTTTTSSSSSSSTIERVNINNRKQSTSVSLADLPAALEANCKQQVVGSNQSEFGPVIRDESEQQQVAATNGSRASYYKSRIKSFRDEMVKLNSNHRQSLAASARRISMAMQTRQSSSASTASKCSSSSSSLSPVESGQSAKTTSRVPPVRPRTSISSNKLEAKQRPEAASEQQQPPKSILKKKLNASRSMTDLAHQEDTRSTHGDAREEPRIVQATTVTATSQVAKEEDIHSQLIRLRAGSTNSISIRGKSRQREPAQLIDMARKDDEAAQEVDHDKRNSPLSSPTQVKTNTSAGEAVKPGHQKKIDKVESREEPRGAQLSKKSEFDPRSLRLKTQTARFASRPLRSSTLIAKDADGRLELANKRTSLAMRREADEKDAGVILSPVGALEDAVVTSNSSNESDEDEADQVGELKSSSTNQTENNKSRSFNLLRQSFNQKTLSSVLKFSSRASLRIRSVASSLSQDNERATTTSEPGKGGESAKAEAIRIAEANLLAARQLKQQAQRLKEQQKRVEQQQATIDSTALMLFNQHIQRQQQQQQQLILTQQHQLAAYRPPTAAPPAHLMFDAFQQHQQMLQYRQQHQLAYLNSSAHLMQMAAIQPQAPSQPLVYYAHPNLQHHQMFATKGSQIPVAGHLLYPQVEHKHQYIPMSVNHSSSLNIVYAGLHHHQQPPPLQAPPPIPPPERQHQQQQVRVFREQATGSAIMRSKQSSLGASMRKTVKSILGNTNGTSKATLKVPQSEHQVSAGKLQPATKLKSALKSKPNMALNSEGSDADNSSSSGGGGGDLSVSQQHQHQQQRQRSPLQLKQTGDIRDKTMSSSDSSLASCSGSSSGKQDRQSTLTRRELDKIRQNLLSDKATSKSINSNGLRASTKRTMSNQQSLSFSSSSSTSSTSSTGSMMRKNVTFSTELTSIL